jgi:16S rRNA (cytosine1407-C5)-methyltransferase
MKRKKVKSRLPVDAAPYQERVLQRYQLLLPANDYAQLRAEIERPLFPALRANPLKVDPGTALKDWAERYHWESIPVPFCPTGIQVKDSEKPISQTIEHRLGYYYIQDAASMLPVELFDFPVQGPGATSTSPLILDLAASPGGKTTHLASRTGDSGLIIANDASQSRITALRLVLHNWGAVNCAITHFPGEMYGSWYPETFDRVLLDAPCSMESLRSSESHPFRPITPTERSSLAQRQERLLESAIQSTKIGGRWCIPPALWRLKRMKVCWMPC